MRRSVRNALMTLDFVFTIMHYVILYHFMVMLSSRDPLSCHALDFLRASSYNKLSRC